MALWVEIYFIVCFLSKQYSILGLYRIHTAPELYKRNKASCKAQTTNSWPFSISAVYTADFSLSLHFPASYCKSISASRLLRAHLM